MKVALIIILVVAFGAMTWLANQAPRPRMYDNAGVYFMGSDYGTVYEDGSYIIVTEYETISGCMPRGLCQKGKK